MKLRENKKIETPKIDLEILDDISKLKIDKLRLKVLTQDFKWGFISRVNIPKVEQPKKTGPLGTPTVKDRFV